MDWETIDWKALAQLRATFLDGTAGATDYWRNERVLESYDQTFGQRIRWKWDYVLKELKARNWTLPRGEIVDWGCGTGVATRAVVAHFAFDPSNRINLWDRSPTAMQYAAREIREGLAPMGTRRGRGSALLVTAAVLACWPPAARAAGGRRVLPAWKSRS